MGTMNKREEMDNHLLFFDSLTRKYLKECRVMARLAKERSSVLKINDINDVSLFGTPDFHHCISTA
jgi:hypothetical protein